MGWLSGWTYRKRHEIKPSSGAGTNYQIKLEVKYGIGFGGNNVVYLNQHSRTDFGDVRFTKEDGVTLLDYWIEEKEDSNYAIFWVKIPDDLSNNSVVICVYYGNSNATYSDPQAHGEDTFEFFDDFPGSSID